MSVSTDLSTPELEYLQMFLHTASIPATYHKQSTEKAFDNLLIFIGENGDQEDWARLYFMTDVLTGMKQPVPDQFHVLDLTLPLGVMVPNNHQKKTSWLLSILNSLLPGPVLLFNQQDGIFFRTSFVMQEQDAFWPGLLLDALELLKFLLPRVRPSIQALLAGEKKVDEALTDIEKQLSAPPQDAKPLFHTSD